MPAEPEGLRRALHCVGIPRIVANSLLELTGFAVASGGVPLLSGIRLAVAPGEMVALVGPSGCGKTTLLRAMAGLIDPVDGEVTLQGRHPEELGWPVFRRHVSLVSQRPVLFEASVRENLARPFRYRTAQEPFPEERAATLLDHVGVGSERLEQAARSLSEGQQQRVSVVRALLATPLVFLLDEPTSALDENAVAGIEDVLRSELKASRRDGVCPAAVIVTHDRGQADRWCDRVYDLGPHAVETRTPTAEGVEGGARDG